MEGKSDAGAPLDVSVVVATFNRETRLRAMLDGLRLQTHPRDRFEVVVVNDCSTDETSRALEAEARRGELRLRVVGLATNQGRAAARQAGWREARANLIAFTDDDCVPDPGWLAAGLEAAGREPGAIIQGRTEPATDELMEVPPHRRAFTRTIRVAALDPTFQTCNIFYPRPILEGIGGFDTDSFGRVHGGEDSDLAWRAIEAGASVVFAPDASVVHAVNQLGPVGKLRVAAGWEMLAVARHPRFRGELFERGIFWKGSHYLLLRALVAVALPRRLAWLRPWLAYPYASHLLRRGQVEGGGPLLAPYYVLYDIVETVAVARSAVRYRTPML